MSLFDTIYINNQAVRLQSYKELGGKIGPFVDFVNLDEEKTKMARQEPTLNDGSSYCVIVRVRVVLKRPVVGDRRFDNLAEVIFRVK